MEQRYDGEEHNVWLILFVIPLEYLFMHCARSYKFNVVVMSVFNDIEPSLAKMIRYEFEKYNHVITQCCLKYIMI